MEVAEVVRLLAEADAGVAPAELLDQEGVVLLDDLPDQLSWNGGHWKPSKCCIKAIQMD